jgi:SAM-dependent methyltransferase
LERDLGTPLEQQQLRVAGETGDTFWHRVRFRLVEQAAARTGADTVLDIGAGSGQLGDWLHRSSVPLEYRFGELSPLLEAALAARFGADRRADPDARIPAATIVTMLDVLEHIDDDLGVLRDIHRRMTPGGQMLVTVPAFQWAFTSWDTSLGHYRRYSRPQLRSLARTAGFEVDHCSYLFPELLPLVLVRKLRPGERTHADFPELPRVVDRAAELVSRGTTAMRRIWPAGTSVTALLTKTGPAQ